MAAPTIAELDTPFAAIRANIVDLVEQAAAYSSAGDEGLVANRIAQQEEELARVRAMAFNKAGQTNIAPVEDRPVVPRWFLSGGAVPLGLGLRKKCQKYPGRCLVQLGGFEPPTS